MNSPKHDKIKLWREYSDLYGITHEQIDECLRLASEKYQWTPDEIAATPIGVMISIEEFWQVVVDADLQKKLQATN